MGVKLMALTLAVAQWNMWHPDMHRDIDIACLPTEQTVRHGNGSSHDVATARICLVN
jgi:hypothetical protein